MMTKAISAVASVLTLGCVATAAMAADDGLPTNPNSNANTIPAPNAATPSDPAANDNPLARIPTTENEGYRVLREGYSVGTSGQGIVAEQDDD